MSWGNIIPLSLKMYFTVQDANCIWHMRCSHFRVNFKKNLLYDLCACAIPVHALWLFETHSMLSLLLSNIDILYVKYSFYWTFFWIILLTFTTSQLVSPCKVWCVLSKFTKSLFHKLRNQYKACWYLFECISRGDTKYSNDISECWYFLAFCESLNPSSDHACRVVSVNINVTYKLDNNLENVIIQDSIY